MKLAIKRYVRDFIFDYSTLNSVQDRSEKIADEQNKMREQISAIETRLAENTRALATLALIQSRLLGEINELIESSKADKSKGNRSKIPGTEFTN